MQQTPRFFADRLLAAFDDYHDGFTAITRRAGKRFRKADWQGARRDAVERLELYSRIVDSTVADIRGILEAGGAPQDGWKIVKRAFAEIIRERYDYPLAETFFNSVTRRVFSVLGVNPEIEFTVADFKIPLIEEKPCPICSAFQKETALDDLQPLFLEVFRRFSKELPFTAPAEDSRLAALAVERHLEGRGISAAGSFVEMADSVFYRHKSAYLIGRLLLPGTGEGPYRIQPLVFCVLHIEGKIFVDAVLLESAEVSILFSFANAYFHVEVPGPEEMVNFLKSIIPEKRVSELYTSLGYHKHGKAELYRELTRSLEQSRDRFQPTRGEAGMVMLVFTHPGLDVVFKVIRDRFEHPKKTTHDHIRGRYQLVFRHDRAGRLVDAQEFDHLNFEKGRFSPELLEALFEKAPGAFMEKNGRIILRQLYTERRLTPLDVFIRENPPEAVRAALLDYGWAVKELAAGNIFPGDLFFKNFGVTRWGRVVFYDYDELALLTECRFRKIPQPRSDDEMMAEEAWYSVGDNDVFPEEFRKFLRIPENVREEFEAVHGDLFTPRFWKQMQEKIEGGTPIHILPYKNHRRLDRGILENSGIYYLQHA
jgi:isocitrate dehydrogenase kinase/phosphatase